MGHRHLVAGRARRDDRLLLRRVAGDALDGPAQELVAFPHRHRVDDDLLA